MNFTVHLLHFFLKIKIYENSYRMQLYKVIRRKLGKA